MTNQHKVATDALDTLGTIIDEHAGRDAIHLAVEPVIAGVDMASGDHVVLRDGKAYSISAAGAGVGIVDPFLPKGVKQGEKFWLVVYPRQITSLRHVWEHPSFPSAANTLAVPARSASEVWMRAWAMLHMGWDYYGDRDRVTEDEAYEAAIEAGHRQHVGPYESAADHITDEWWGHWESITGKRGDRGAYFSCSC